MTDDRQKAIVTVVLDLPEDYATTLPAQRVTLGPRESRVVDLWIREAAEGRGAA